MTELDVITVGRVSVDLYAREAGVGFEGAQTFEKSVGGSPTNVAVAAARLGRRAAVATKVGADPFGVYVRRKLESFGVDTRFVGTHPTLRTPLAFAAMDPPDDPPILFYREPNAPDMTIEPGELDAAAVRDVPIFWVSASALSREPIAGTVGALLDERARRPHTVLDLDYRPVFWTSEAEARERIGAAVASCTVAVGNRTECDIAVGSDDPDTAADRLLERGVDLAIVKRGGDGVLVAWSDGRALVPPRPVQVVCGLGAGDAFGGALCHGLLEGWDPRQIVEYANAAGAIVASRLLCSDAMPFDAEVRALLEWSDAAG
ncbi:MAG: 5-dehydro-2-deoxygluconokinase [Acidimicrobiia bacterium]